MKVVYVTCGTKGAGHLVRGVALGRALDRSKFAGSFQIISPIVPLPAMREAIAPYSPTIISIDTREVLDAARAPSSELAKTLGEAAPDLLIVDLFWAPLLRIRESLSCDAWLLVRSCPPIWLRGNAEVRYQPNHYQRVIGIEPVEHDEIREHIEPIVVANPDERRSRAEFCERFGVEPARRIVATSHAGLPGEIDSFGAVSHAADATVVRFDLFADDAVFPLAPWLAEVDEIHCSGGYNSYWEARWLGFAARTTFSLFDRQIDDPRWRVELDRETPMRANGADVLAQMIARG